ncbi:SUMF1/EgtB/PvdO family nonheme iron enzyme [Paenibacillus gansuensis]|uniref:SUMF1/EgtB/PvdO family nonheme iron enzyme n=1 Tax=Paenibacillus gansuensis TaxID=306542 RepID=A0ABW5PIQ4_9BACL
MPIIELDSHKTIYLKDLDLLRNLEERILPEDIVSYPPSKLKQEMNEILAKLSKIEHPVAAEYVFGMAILHPNTYVRYSLVEFVKEWLPYPSALETIYRLLHDPDDLVSFRAMEICGEEGMDLAIGKLTHIIGPANQKILEPNKPVGLGAAKVLTSLTHIYETEDVEELRNYEMYYKLYKKLEDNADFEEHIPVDLLEDFVSKDHEGMVLIPGGFFKYGLEPDQVPDKNFGWSDACPTRTVWQPPFFIDKYPVTNEQYDSFVRDILQNGHVFCHTNEPEEKDHTRNTYWDDRFKPEHPVTGIDYYDAYAFARWAGKDLPTEYQWEKAARGKEGHIWPWGNEFLDKACNWSYTTTGLYPSGPNEWRKHIVGINSIDNTCLVRPASEYAQYASSYGVVGMVGNHWEWTRSDFLTRRNFTPALVNHETKENAYAVLKGGSFYSHPGLMFPSFRGKDIAFCRHNEMGIRCVVNIPINKLRKALGKPFKNKTIY